MLPPSSGLESKPSKKSTKKQVESKASFNPEAEGDTFL
jgi:hypothetical protein